MEPALPGRFRPLRRALRRRDADARARRARAAYREARADPAFEAERLRLLHALRRPPDAALLRAAACPKRSALRVWLKREDLCHTGAHKINNALGQVLLAKRMGKPRIIAETGAGQHGVATATGVRAARPAVRGVHGRRGRASARRRTCAACSCSARRCTPVQSGSRTLKDAMNEAMRDWVTQRADHVLLRRQRGRARTRTRRIVREFQRVIGDEARAQILAATGKLPDAVVACVGGGSNAIGMFAAFLDDAEVRADRRRGRGRGHRDRAATPRRSTRGHASACCTACSSYVLQDDARPDAGGALDQRRPRLPGRRPRARLPQGQRPRRVPCRSPTTRRSTGFQLLCAHRGHHPGARDEPRDRAPAASWQAARCRTAPRGRVPLGPRRQGPGDRHSRALERREGKAPMSRLARRVRARAQRAARGAGDLPLRGRSRPRHHRRAC